MSGVEIVRYEKKYHAAVLELQTRLWSPSLAVNQRYFQWKFVENPHSQFGEIFLAIAGDRLVGMRGFMGTLWTDPAGMSLPVPLAGDTVIAADYEGQGIVNRLSDKGRQEFAKRGSHFILNTSASPMVFWHSRRSGWQAVGRYSFMRRRSGPYWSHRILSKLRRAGLIPARVAADPFAALVGARWRIGGGTTVHLQHRFDTDELADLCKSANRVPRYSLVRDSAFFGWRFNNPLRKYYFLMCRRAGGLSAYLVLSVQEREAGPDVRIVDWMCLQWVDFRVLLDTLASKFPAVSLNMLVNALSPAERSSLIDAGFVDAVHHGTPSSRAMRFKPGLLAVPAANDEVVKDLVDRGFEGIEFKGIESDGA